MFKATFSSSQLKSRTQAYIKYRGELKNIEKEAAGAIEKIRSLVKPLTFMRAKSTKAEEKVNNESNRVRQEMYNKAKQYCDFVDMDPFTARAMDNFYAERKEAESTFNKMMAEAEDKMNHDVEDLLGDIVDKINDHTTSYKHKVEETWLTFKENVAKRMDVDYAATIFEAEIVRSRGDFEAGLKSIMGDFENSTKSAQDDFLKGTFDPAIVQHDTAVNQAVEEYCWWVSSALEFFCLEIDQMVEEGKIQLQSSPSSLEPEKESQIAEEAKNLEGEMEILTVEQLVAMEKKKMAQEKEQQQVENLKVESRKGNLEEASKRLDKLELKMSQVLSTVAEMKERFGYPTRRRPPQQNLQQSDEEKLLSELETVFTSMKKSVGKIKKVLPKQ